MIAAIPNIIGWLAISFARVSCKEYPVFVLTLGIWKVLAKACRLI
jgi:hypothetical protein